MVKSDRTHPVVLLHESQFHPRSTIIAEFHDLNRGMTVLGPDVCSGMAGHLRSLVQVLLLVGHLVLGKLLVVVLGPVLGNILAIFWMSGSPLMSMLFRMLQGVCLTCPTSGRTAASLGMRFLVLAMVVLVSMLMFLVCLVSSGLGSFGFTPS